MKEGFTAIIATLFDPPTLAPLIAALERDGVKVDVIRGQRTNVAWQMGLDRCQTRYAIICNDDIEVYPSSGFVPLLAAAHKRGYTYLVPTLWRSLNTVTPDGNGLAHGVGWSQPKRYVDSQPMDKGHFVSLDLSIPMPPIPDDLTVFYGDDWFYWQHATRGRPMIVTDVQIRTGADLPGFDGTSGFTQRHAGLTEIIGEPIEVIAQREHQVALRYFTFYREEPLPNMWGWYGFSRGLKDYDDPAPTKPSQTPVPSINGLDIEGLLCDLYRTEIGTVGPVRQTIHRFLKYTGPRDVVVDIGASWGALTIVAGLLGAKKIYAVEPDPQNLFMLRDAVAFYGLQDRVTIIDKAISDVSGQMVEWRNAGSSGMSGLLLDPELSDARGAVETLSFRDLMSQVGHVDYMKIDVEGAEHLFLKDDEATVALMSQVGTLDIELHGNGHEVYRDELNAAIEGRVRRLLSLIGIIEDPRDVAHGPVKVAVPA